MPFADKATETTLVRNIITTLMILHSHLRIYQEGNTLVEQTAARLSQFVDTYLADEPVLEIIVARHGFLYHGEFVDRSNKNFERFAGLIFMHGVASLRIKSHLVVAELYSFLRIFQRKPVETWHEGGIRQCMASLLITSLEVSELSENAFQLVDDDGAPQVEAAPSGKSDLWDRFALSLYQFSPGAAAIGKSDWLPRDLAEQTSADLSDKSPEEKARLIREINNFLVFLQHENIRIYRTKALEKLTEYINNLSEELRQLFMQNAFNLTLQTDFAEGFYSGLSDEMIMDALRNASLGKTYTPPVLLRLLGKLAKNRNLTAEDLDLPGQIDTADVEEKTKQLFKADEFEKYVPDAYRAALLNIVRSDKLEGDLFDSLTDLKGTLGDQAVESHIADILLEILQHNPDERHIEGIRLNLDKMLIDYLEQGDYAALLRLHALCARSDSDGSGAYEQLRASFSSDDFAESALSGAKRFGRERFESLKSLILTVGEPFAAPLMDRLANESNRSIRYFYMDCLKSMQENIAEQALTHLKDQRWYFVRNVICLLREMNDPAILPKIRPMLRHPHGKVRFEAIKTCLYFRDPQAERYLLEQLSSDDHAVVVDAVGLARLAKNEKIVQRLLELLEESSLLHFKLDLKKSVVRSLAEIAHPRLLPVFDELLASRSFLHPRQLEQLKVEVVRGLDRFEAKAVVPLLQKQQAYGSNEVARAAREMLQRMGGTGR